MNLAKHSVLLFALGATLAVAQTPTSATPKSTTAAPKSATGTATAKTGTAAKTPVSGIKLPPGVPPGRGLLKTAFSLRYQDLKIGTGALAEPLKLYKVHYTGWLAADGTKFDSSFDHLQPMKDKDGKPVLDADGKPKMGDPEPIQFPQGRGRVIPGWDQGFEGMKIGGKRRLFIPYQLAYGAAGRPPKIPAKSDLIFDVELIDTIDMPAQPMPGMPGGRPMPPRPGMTPGGPAGPGGTPSAPGAPVTQKAPGAPPTASAPSSAPAPAAPASAPAPAAPATPTAPPDSPK
jgi:peptidylprolyl isomerase